MENTIYISIPQQDYTNIKKRFETLENEFDSFKEECSKDSKYIIVSEHYDIIKHLDYRFKNNPLLGVSKEDYIKTYKGTTYESLLNDLVISLENTHSKIIKNIKAHIDKNTHKKESKLSRILKIIKE